jgi:hypothetical protein
MDMCYTASARGIEKNIMLLNGNALKADVAVEAMSVHLS